MNPIYAAIGLPLFGAFIVGCSPGRLKSRISVFILGLTFISTLFAAAFIFRSQEAVFINYLTGWLSLSFLADGTAVFMALVSSFVALLIGLYSLEYMEDYENKGEFFFWTVLFIGSMMGLIFSANLLLMFCFWEMTSVCSWRLIGFYRKEKDLKSADKAFLVTFFGASLMLAGIALIYLNHSTLDITALRGMALPNLAAFLLLAGILSKSAQIPLQTWLPDAGVAPTPVTALLHAAVLVKIGIYVFARLFGLTFFTSPLFLHAAIFISIATILVAASCALMEDNMKRILAYSTISQLGYIMLALALNTDISFKIALTYILAHSLAKAGLFLCAGIVEHKTKTKDINEMGGLIKTMPLTGLSYLLCAFSIIGIPPFLGFWPKFFVVMLSLKQGYILVSCLAVIGAVLTLMYLMRLFNKVFLGEARIVAKESRSSSMVWVVLVLGFLSLAAGVFFKIPFGFISNFLR